MIKDMLNTVPARPVLFLAPVVICAVLGLYYFDSYQSCTEQSELRNRFMDVVQQTSEQAGAVFDMDTTTNFSWDTLRVVNAVKTEATRGAGPNCPFDWDWSRNQREELAAQGQLNLMLFFDAEKIVKYMELDGQAVNLEQLKEIYDVSEARFKVSSDAANASLVLREYNDYAL